MEAAGICACLTTYDARLMGPAATMLAESALVAHLNAAARLAIRGHGGAEPNPLVGCIVLDLRGKVAGWGLHSRCGGAHAEVEALRAAGSNARGGTAVVTLEPCNHFGRTGPCTMALRAAGIARVVFGVSDPHPKAQGGAAALREAGIAVTQLATPQCRALAAPFLHRTDTGLPWVVAKWAQTIDGRIDRFAAASRWISSARSRALVHRERGRVDAIFTGIGTVLADDPRLTARAISRRRRPIRVVWDPELAMPPEAAMLSSIGEAPVMLACNASAAGRAGPLVARGATIIECARGGEGLRQLMSSLSARHGVATVLVEAGQGLTSRLLEADLLNEAWVFTAPIEGRDCPAAQQRWAPALPSPFHLVDQRLRGGDTVSRYRR